MPQGIQSNKLNILFANLEDLYLLYNESNLVNDHIFHRDLHSQGETF